MKSQPNENRAKADRYVVLLKDGKKSSINKAEKELNIKMVSSAELNSKNRSYQVMNADTGIFYKNLNVGVVDEVHVDILKAAVKDKDNPIIYWEEEKEYRPVSELELLVRLKNTTLELQQHLEELEQLLKNKNEDSAPEPEDLSWGLEAINIAATDRTGKGIKTCILDTGLYKEHPDFEGRNIEGKSFIEGEVWDRDRNGHGTHCAGIAVGNISNQGKRYGVANEADIFIGKVLSDSGSGSTSGIIDAIDWALEKGCKVISMSLGAPTGIGENPSRIFERAGEKALENGCLLIAAAGNDSRRPNFIRPVSSPANAQSIMAIGALDKTPNIAKFSNAGLNTGTGGRIDLAAPGVDIFSSFSKNASGNQLYRRLNGTSMATPFVAGIATLLWEAFPNASAADIWLKLEKNSKPLNHLESRDIGQGIAQAI